MDFVFTDSLTCYDCKDGQWYMRANYDEAAASLTAAPFVCEAGAQWTITFRDTDNFYPESGSPSREGEPPLEP